MRASAARCWICIVALQNKECAGNWSVLNDTDNSAVLHKPCMPRDSNGHTKYIY